MNYVAVRNLKPLSNLGSTHKLVDINVAPHVMTVPAEPKSSEHFCAPIDEVLPFGIILRCEE